MRSFSKQTLAIFCCSFVLLPLTGWAQESEIELESAVYEARDICKSDIDRFCEGVTEGEGRVLACLMAYDDQVSKECGTILNRWDRPDLVEGFKTTQSYPTLGARDLGTQNTNEDGERVIWKQKLPFLAQKVVDLGFDLPNPYGVAIVPAFIRQDLILDNLAIGIGGPPDREIDFVDFGTPSVENSTVQFKADAWVLPFLSVFTTIGKFDGEGTIPLKFVGSDLFPALCEVTPNAPVCVRTYSGVAKPEYEGDNISVGMTVAMGWDRFFVVLPLTYAWTDVNILNETVTALNITPRIGMTGDMGDRGTVAVFMGATYLRAEVDIAGEISLETPGGPVGDITTLSFRISQRNKDRWNGLIGFNWEMNKTWSVMAEAGFGGSRENFIAGATYRF